MKRLIVILGSLLFTLSAFARTGVFPQESFDQLSYGLYWFGANNQYQKASQATQYGGQYYDPSKPTLILIHGWQLGNMSSQDRFVYWENDGGSPDIDFANIWIAQGYNVGMIYWDQFADELDVRDAEAKIWTATSKHNMRWKDSDGDYHDGPSQNVTELLLANYLTAMKEYTGHDLRLAGHSLGNQVALRLADELATLADKGQIPEQIVPQRVSLLDSFYSNYSKDYLGYRWVGEVARDIVSHLKPRGIAIDSYRTSIVTSSPFVGDENRELDNSVAFVEQLTQFFNQTQISQKHGAAIWLYLWSILYPTPPVTDNTLPGLSAAASNDEVRQWMATTDHLIQTEGGSTKDPQDNIYKTGPAL